jgi:hypothetical protein
MAIPNVGELNSHYWVVIRNKNGHPVVIGEVLGIHNHGSQKSNTQFWYLTTIFNFFEIFK